jgi:hypothetical protein
MGNIESSFCAGHSMLCPYEEIATASWMRCVAPRFCAAGESSNVLLADWAGCTLALCPEVELEDRGK